MAAKAYRIEVLTHPSVGLLIARSPDLAGFLAHGNDLAQLRDRILPAMEALLEAKGLPTDGLRIVEEAPIGHFERTSMKVETATAA